LPFTFQSGKIRQAGNAVAFRIGAPTKLDAKRETQMNSEICIRGCLLAPCVTEQRVSCSWLDGTPPPILSAARSSLLLKMIAGIFSVAPLLVSAETELHDYASSFTFENDLFFKTDRYYTDGVQLTVKGRIDARSERTKSRCSELS